MTHPRRFRLQAVRAVVALAAGVCLLVPATAGAQGPEHVAVVINENSAASVFVGEHYVKARRIPPSNVFRLRTSLEDTIDREAFVRTIQQPLAAAIIRERLQDRLLYIVLAKDVPLRIAGTTGPEGTMASVDSELTLLYRQMTGRPMPTAGPLPNPYFLGTRQVADAERFTRRAYDIYLVSRLDAFTPVEAAELVDKSLAAVPDGRIVLQQRGSLAANAVADGWLAAASKSLRAQGHGDRVLFDTAEHARAGSAPVLGYFSWGSADPALRARHMGLQFAPGALAATFVGTSARTFSVPPPAWVPTESANPGTWFAGSPQSLLGDLIREGATGAAGYVAEPYFHGVIRPDILFPAYLAGFNLIEAFYLATPMLSWRSVIVGDPLCAPFARAAVAAGDIDAGIDRRTELPLFFSERRLEVAMATFGVTTEVAAHIARAESLLARDERAPARQALEAAVRSVPGQAPLHMQLAVLAQQMGDHREAIARYRRVLELRPDDVTAMNNLAYVLAVEGKAPEEARPLAERAVVLSNRNPIIVDTLGWIEHLLGNHTAAAQLLREAAAGATGIPDVRLHAAIALASTAPAEAGEHLRHALRLQPSFGERADVRALQRRLEGW